MPPLMIQRKVRMTGIAMNMIMLAILLEREISFSNKRIPKTTNHMIAACQGMDSKKNIINTPIDSYFDEDKCTDKYLKACQDKCDEG